MTDDEMKELRELREYKAQHEGKALNRAFNRLEQLIEMSHMDPQINIRAFSVISECLLCLKEELIV